MNPDSDYETVFSSRQLEEPDSISKDSKPNNHSPTASTNIKSNLSDDGIVNPMTTDLTPSHAITGRKGSDEYLNDIQARKAEQIQKYNVFSFTFPIFKTIAL